MRFGEFNEPQCRVAIIWQCLLFLLPSALLLSIAAQSLFPSLAEWRWRAVSQTFVLQDKKSVERSESIRYSKIAERITSANEARKHVWNSTALGFHHTKGDKRGNFGVMSVDKAKWRKASR